MLPDENRGETTSVDQGVAQKRRTAGTGLLKEPILPGLGRSWLIAVGRRSFFEKLPKSMEKMKLLR